MILEQLRKYAELKQSEKVLLNEIAYLKEEPEPVRNVRLIRSLQNIVRRLESEQRQTEQFINAETDPTARKIMDLHFVQGKPWEEVCQILFGYPDRFYCYRTIARKLQHR